MVRRDVFVNDLELSYFVSTFLAPFDGVMVPFCFLLEAEAVLPIDIDWVVSDEVGTGVVWVLSNLNIVEVVLLYLSISPLFCLDRISWTDVVLVTDSWSPPPEPVAA